VWGGHARSGWYHVVDERGTWALAGDQLTLTPTKVTATEIDETKQTKKPVKVALEKTTYTVQKVYMDGIQEWNLILTTPKPTKRDGAFVASDTYKSSYLLGDKPAFEWRYPPK
jgi:hypothetical protein